MNVLDWQSVLALMAVGIAAITMVARMLDKSLSIREHEEYKKGSQEFNKIVKDHIIREIDRIEKRLDQIENTRPTTSELELSADNLKSELRLLESRLNNLPK